jgi:hypothetical protein
MSTQPESSERPLPGPTVAHLSPTRLGALAALAFSRAGQAQQELLTAADEKGGDRAVVETALMTRPPILHAADLARG